MQNAIDQSLIYCMLINPSLYPILSKFFTFSTPKFQLKCFNQTRYSLISLLINMNSLLDENLKEKEKKLKKKKK